MEDVITEFSLRGALNHALFQFVAMGLTIFIIPKLRVSNISGAFIILGAIALVNSTVWDAGLFLGVPDNLSSQAIQIVVVNGLIFWVLVKALPGIECDGILPALIAPITFAIVSSLLRVYAKDVDWIELIETGFGYLMSYRDTVKGE
jgi:uncharacterized membrane protein YvlD (DUF360 family)